MLRAHRLCTSFLSLLLPVLGIGCSDSSGLTATLQSGGQAAAPPTNGDALGSAGAVASGGTNGLGGSGAGTGGSAQGGKLEGGAAGAMSAAGAAAGGRPAGWLYTEGAQLKVSDGKGSGTRWLGRGVNTDDIFFCGYNNSLWMADPGAELGRVLEGLLTDWKPTFIRLSLFMDSYGTPVSWLTDADKYRTPMVQAIKSIGQHPGVYVLVVLRSDASMIGHDREHGDPEATGIPSDSQTTPDKTKFPTGTDAVYEALVETFKDDAFVMFGLTNEPGGNLLPTPQIRNALDHAVTTIRAAEDKLGVPHHVVAVQGQGWTSDIGSYAAAPLAHDNLVYEVHGYPPPATSYSYDNIPVIIGEYGMLDETTAPAFFADIEAKQLPNLAWDFDPFSNCAPDLLEVSQSSTALTPSPWGALVKAYLLEHAK